MLVAYTDNESVLLAHKTDVRPMKGDLFLCKKKIKHRVISIILHPPKGLFPSTTGENVDILAVCEWA